MPQRLTDAAAARYVLLDMGKEKYGDCIVCLLDGKKILIDGGHPGDFDGQSGSDSIPDQLAAILGGQPPFKFDLLVVTHCHLDHIGCLPKMVEENVVRFAWALVADEKIGWGKRVNAPDSDSLPADPVLARVVAAMREEPRADDFEDDEAVERFIDAAVTLETQYKTMLAALEAAGTKVVRYGRDETAALEAEFSATGLTILGPTGEHLEICRKAIAGSMEDAVSDAARLLSSDAKASSTDLYRILAAPPSNVDAPDAGRLGAALNDQSILLRFGSDSKQVLLTGDMQFTEPGVNGLDDEMTALRAAVKGAGPYKVVKLPHHGSHNGFDDELRQEWASTKLFVISGGSADPGHPDTSVRTLLKTEQDDITWARTDKNGAINVSPSSSSEPLKVSKGMLNDSRQNPAPPLRPRQEDVEIQSQIQVVKQATSGAIELIARIPDTLRRVVITVETEQRDGGATVIQRRLDRKNGKNVRPEPVDGVGKLASGRIIPKLLFISNRKKLAANIGKEEADAAIAMIESAHQTYFDVTNPARAFDLVRGQLSDRYKGVVIVGGYDVLPAQRIDTLPADLREELADAPATDADNFLVWSDSIYGDTDRDPNGLPEVPVSRIPDGKSSRLVLAALQAGNGRVEKRFALYNSKRPFAKSISADLVPGTGEPLLSLPALSEAIVADAVAVPFIYLMLHGYDSDGTLFSGEEPTYPEALHIEHVPQTGAGIVFSGCCWGALTVHQPAARVRPGRPVTPRTPEESIALSFLQAGYTAFVGCTGSHYSPAEGENNCGSPMHISFWKYLKGGEPPALALFHSKLDYLRDLPHGLTDPEDIALEHKTLRQFTCLGLGW